MATSDEAIGAADASRDVVPPAIPSAQAPDAAASGREAPRSETPGSQAPRPDPAGSRAATATPARPPARPARRVDEEPAFLLHALPYRETSLILELFTREHGRIAAVARGAKRPRSKLRAVLLAFQPLQVTWTGGAELRNLIGAEWVGGLPAPQGDALLCAFYVNELLLKLLPREDPHPALFDGYVETLGRLGHDEPPEPALRRFEWLLLRESGFGVDLKRDADGALIQASRRYAFRAGAGFIDPLDPNAPTYSGATLLDLAQGRFDVVESLAEAKQLSRTILNQQLEGKALATRQILIDLQRL